MDVESFYDITVTALTFQEFKNQYLKLSLTWLSMLLHVSCCSWYTNDCLTDPAVLIITEVLNMIQM
jgi:hypothetical protein